MDFENQMPQDAPGGQPIGDEQLRQFLRILQRYKTGKIHTEGRIKASEQWWKLRNTQEEKQQAEILRGKGFSSVSAWLHNVITSKHADAVESYPEPNILPREPGDQDEAKRLSSILPCVLEQNDFEQTYSDVMWQKCKTGTGVYKVTWDTSKLNGLGDISIVRANLLNLYWEPGITDIQKSRFFFHTELWDKDLLLEQYPQLEGKLKSSSFISTKFLYDDSTGDEDKATVIEVYYHKDLGGKKTLQYCKFVGETVLFATENEPDYAQRGLYDHGRFPYEFDPLFPIEGSPCGYGYVDICRNPQTEIDLLKTCFVKNAMQGAVPRFFSRSDGSINEEEMLDLSKSIVHTQGNLGEDSLREIPHKSLDGAYINMMDRAIQELRETSGNTETATGSTSSGVTAASAIAALQEASGKGSRDATRASYRAFSNIVGLCIELIRQFYDLPRQFRILGENGAMEFASYDNSGLAPQPQIGIGGADLGMRLPVFDIKVSAQKANVYTKVTQNELALQFYQMGFFNPQMADQSLLALQMMDFDGKDSIMQRISRMGTMQQKLGMYMQMAMGMAARMGDTQTANMVAMDMQTMGVAPQMAAGPVNLQESDNIAGLTQQEHGIVRNARERANNATQPGGGQ